MRYVLVATLAIALLMLWVPASSSAATVDFTATLSGAAERPDPVDTAATGSATGTLTGDVGLWVFTYHIEYEGLSGPATVGHIHDAINPGGQPFTEQFGSPVHDLPSLESPIDGTWSYTDAGQPLTDELAAALQAGRLYINIHSDLYPAGEIRGQLVPVDDEPPPPPPGVIPLPAPIFAGMMGLAMAGAGVWRQRRRTA